MYPTRVRSFALGLNNSMSRLGAIIAPFLSVDLGQGGHLQLAEGAITGCCLVAAICTCVLPYETSGMNLQVKLQLGTVENILCADETHKLPQWTWIDCDS